MTKKSRALERSKALDEAISNLASLFECGELLAATVPADFMNAVAEEIKKLRARLPKLEGHVKRLETSLDLLGRTAKKQKTLESGVIYGMIQTARREK